jgi:hypothetical protein
MRKSAAGGPTEVLAVPLSMRSLRWSIAAGSHCTAPPSRMAFADGGASTDEFAP